LQVFQYFDVGEILIEKVLKGSWTQATVPFVCHSFDQTQLSSGLNLYGPGYTKYFSGMRGIWLLNKSELFRSYFVIKSKENFLGISSLPKVKKYLNKIK